MVSHMFQVTNLATTFIIKIRQLITRNSWIRLNVRKSLHERVQGSKTPTRRRTRIASSNAANFDKLKRVGESHLLMLDASINHWDIDIYL